MTELTQDQRDTLARAQGREGKTTRGDWRFYGKSELAPNYFWSLQGLCDADGYRDARPVLGAESVEIDERDIEAIRVFNESDTSLIEDAPNLDDLCRAQAHIITEQAARIAALEAEIDGINAMHGSFFNEVWPMIENLKRYLTEAKP